MYGRGNHDPPLGHGLQRPMPLFQQQLPGHPSASRFQTGNSIPLQPLNQQGGPPHGAPPLGPSYLHAPPAPLNMPQQGPPVSTSNTGQYYLHPPLTAHNGLGVRLPLLAAQQNFVSRSQNPHLPPHPPPSMGPRVPPAPPFMQLPPPPPQTAPVFSPVNFESAKPQSAETHMPGVAPQPPPLPPSLPPSAPPPPPSSCSPLSPEKLPTPTYIAAKPPIQSGHDPNSDRVLVSESSGNIPTHSLKSGETQISDEDMSLKQSVLVDLPPPPTPPPKPADENIVRNIEVLCQFIAKNGSEFEEMVREKESGNPEFNFLVGGDPGSDASRAHEYFLWMKKKRNIENNLHKDQNWRDLVERDVDVNPSPRLDSLSNIGKAHSPADSDVDMEDDITQSDKDHGVYYSVEDEEPESVLAGDIYKRSNQENDNELQHLRDYSPAPMSSPSVKHQVDSESMPEKPAVQCTTIHSPFRMIQNYASDDSADDDAEPCHENVKARVVSPLGKASSSHDGVEHINTNCKRNVTSEIGLGQSVTTCSGSGLTKERADMQQIQGDLPEAPARMLYGKCKTNELDGRIEGPNTNTFHGNYASRSTGIESVSIYKDEKKGEKKDTATAAKVDEFGRLVKEGASESESDDSHHLRRRGRRDRSRSRSRSRSPSDRRRRRRRRSPRKSPRRRKERRSRSRSWSPKRRRSRSRSPYRSGGDFRADKLRRGKIQNCFDFLEGRCYRGASCRYVHHESDKIEISRGNNSKQHQIENVACVPINSPQEHADRKVEKMHLDLDKRDSHNLGLQTSDERSKAEFIDDALQPSVPHLDSEKVATDIKKCDGVRSGDQVAGASDEPTSHLPIFQEHSSSGMPPTNAVVLDPQAQGSAASNHRLNEEPQKMDNSSKVDSSTVQTSSISLSGNEPSVHKMSDESTAPNASVLDFSHQVSNLPPPPLVQQATNAPQGPNIQENHNLVAPSSSFHPHSVPIESGPLYQQSQNSVPPHPAWNTLLQPRPPNMVGPSIAGDLLQYQQGDFPLRNDFPGHFQMGGFSHQTYHLPSINIPAQPFAGSNLVRDDRYSQFPTQSRVPSSSFVPGVAPQPVPFQGDSTVRNTQSFPGDNLLMGESSKPFFQNQNHQFVQQRMPPFGAQLTASESMPSHFGGSVSVPGYSSNVIDRDKSTYFDVGESRISTHYNPYASTFDQPLSTRFSSIATGGIKYDSSFGLGHAPIDGQTAGDHGSKRFISSSKAEGKTVLKSGGDQYDPSFDSIDPFSDSIKKHAEKQDHAADNSDIMLKLSSRHIVLAVEENKQKLVGAAAATVSLENDEFGETADAEVGAVENGSPSNSNEDADVADGDTEIDQVKSEGRSKKNKDSRSMKLFKVAVTNFVKEVLKPQWRQGNMSKEVFKTIVKKTVDKVSGAMKNHRLPKSQAKIDHYIDSSRRKLTQLVQGYVSKYKS